MNRRITTVADCFLTRCRSALHSADGPSPHPVTTTHSYPLSGGETLTAHSGCCLTALLIAVFGMMQVADGVITYLGLGALGLDEANPLLAIVAGVVGLGGAIAAIKLCGLAFITYLFFDRHKMRSHWITATLASADTFYGWVLTNNLGLVLAT